MTEEVLSLAAAVTSGLSCCLDGVMNISASFLCIILAALLSEADI